MGPVPSALEEITAEMVKKKMLGVERIDEHEGYNATEVYKYLTEPDLSVFNEEEKKMLDRVILKYGHLTGKQLEDLSHAEAPYAAAKLYEEVPYEFTYYRGTDFSDLR